MHGMKGPAYFEIQADDCARAVDFYGQVFGWQFTRDENLPIEYWRIETDGAKGGLLKRPAAIAKGPTGTNAFVCSMEVLSFDESAALILSLGGKVAMEKFEIPGKCWQGYFLDTEGNTFGIFEVDESLRETRDEQM
jgi:predicted enzyme related to lactoylglutathione lyase